MHFLLASLLVLPAAIAQDVIGADIKPTITSTPEIPEIPDVPLPQGYASFNGSNPEPAPCTDEEAVTVTRPGYEPTSRPGHMYTPMFPGEPGPSDVPEPSEGPEPPSTTEHPPEWTDVPAEPQDPTSYDDSTTSTPTEAPSDKPCTCEDEPTTFETSTPPIATGTGVPPPYSNSTNGTYTPPPPPLGTNTGGSPAPTNNGSVTVPNGPSPTSTGDPLFTDAATALERWSSAGLVAAIAGVVFAGL